MRRLLALPLVIAAGCAGPDLSDELIKARTRNAELESYISGIEAERVELRERLMSSREANAKLEATKRTAREGLLSLMPGEEKFIRVKGRTARMSSVAARVSRGKA